MALVTGASRGIGKGIALALAKEGAKVACLASSAGGEATAAQAGNGAIGLVCNVAEADQAQEAVSQVVERLGGLHIVVNNAGIARDQLLLRMTQQEWDEVIAVNLTGPFNIVKAAAKPMMKARWGRIINISSIVGLSGQAGQANYAASKAGLIGFTKAVAKEFGSRGITCNAIAPGFIETDMTSELPLEMREHVHNSAPSGRLGTVEDIAAAAVFLAGEGASYITGQVLTVDGGLTL